MALAEISESKLASKVILPGILSGKLSSPYNSGEWHKPPAQFSEPLSPVVTYISRRLRSEKFWTLEGVRFFTYTYGEAAEEEGVLVLVYRTEKPPTFRSGFLGHRLHLNLKEIFDSSITLREDHHLRQGAVYERSAGVVPRFPTDWLTPEQILIGNVTPGSLRWSYKVRVEPFVLTNRKSGYLAAEDPTRVRFDIVISDALQINRSCQQSALEEWEQRRIELEKELEQAKLTFNITSTRNALVLSELEKLPKPPLQLTP